MEHRTRGDVTLDLQQATTEAPTTPRSGLRFDPLLVLGLVCCLTVTAGCVSTDGGIDGEDSTTGTLAARISWEPGTRSEGRDEAESRLSYDLDFTRGTAQDPISIPPGQSIEIGGVTFFGSENVAFFDLDRVLLDARLSKPLGSGFSVDAFGGLEYTSLVLTLQSAGQPGVAPHASESISALGPALGVGVAWQPRGWLRCSSEARVGYGFSSDADGVEVYSLDLGVGLFPWRSFGFYGGWRSLSYAADRGAPEVDVTADLSGPVIGLQIRI